MTRLESSSKRALLLGGIAALVAAMLGPAPSAHAAEASWLTVPGGLPLFDLEGIAPGETGSATFTVTNPQSLPVEFSIGIPSIVSDDNGCNEPERESGDTTCGAGGGELQLDLRLALSAIGTTDRAIGAGTIVEWVATPRVDTFALAGHEARSYRLVYELPLASSNVTQSDLVAFAFELRLEHVLDSLASDPPVALVDATPSLPQTGIDPGLLATLGLSTAAAGVALHSWSAHRRRAG